MPKKIEISHRTIIFTVLFLLGLWFLYRILDVLTAVFIALLLMAVLIPIVIKLSKLKLPRSVSVIIVYIIIFALIGAVIGMMLPPTVEQTANFAKTLPSYLERIGASNVITDEINRQVAGALSAVPSFFIKTSISIFSNVWALFSVLILAFYMLIARDKLDDQIASLFGAEKKKSATELLNDIETGLGGWMRAQFTLMFLIGVISYIGLFLLGIPFALPLAIFAGIMEIVPIIGPVISAIPVVIIAFGISPLMGTIALLFVILIQMVENYFFVPKVFERSVGVSPIVTLILIAIGSKMAGIMGVFLSIPIFLLVQLLYKKYFILDK